MHYDEKIEEDKLTLKESFSKTDLSDKSVSPAMETSATAESNSESGEDVAPPEEELLPDFGQNFEVLKLVGRGGMSTVYKARNNQTGSIVAIKVMSAFLAKDRAALKRFEKESQSLVELDDPELLTVYGSGVTEDGAPYLVMEFIEGDSLAEILSNERIDAKRALALSIEICKVLSRAHKRGIVHRDIKPSNIMVTNLIPSSSGAESVNLENNEQVRIVDFGIARIVESTTGNTISLTQTGAIFGTPTYMSPEQCRSNQVADHRADIYALGCLMYELLTGKPPFLGDNPIQVAMAHLNDPPEQFPKTLKDKTIKSMEPIVLKCLEKDKSERYQSADQLLKELIKVRDGRRRSFGWNPFKTKPKKAPAITDPTPFEGIAYSYLLFSSFVIPFVGSIHLTNLDTPVNPTLTDLFKILCVFFIGFNAGGLFLLPKLARRQYRYLRTNEGMITSADIWSTVISTICCANLLLGFLLFGLSLCQLLKDSPLLALTMPVLSVSYLLALLLLLGTGVLALVVDRAKKLKRTIEPISLRKALIQLSSVTLLGLSALIISFFATPQFLSWGLLPAASVLTVAEAKPMARTILETATYLNPSNSDAAVALANVDELLNDNERKLVDLNRTIQSNPDDGRLKFLRASVNHRLNNTQAGLKDMEGLIEMLDEQEKNSETIDKQTPDFKPEAKLNSSLRFISKDMCLNERAKLHTKEHRYDDAIKDLTEAIHLQPQSQYFRHRGSLYAATKDYKRAADDLYKALISYSDYLDYLRLATIFELQGDSESAKDYYTMTTKSYTTDNMAKAIAFRKLNQNGKAEACLKDFSFKTKTLESLSKELFDEDLHIPINWSGK